MSLLNHILPHQSIVEGLLPTFSGLAVLTFSHFYEAVLEDYNLMKILSVGKLQFTIGFFLEHTHPSRDMTLNCKLNIIKISVISLIVFSLVMCLKYISQCNNPMICCHFSSSVNSTQLNKGFYFIKASGILAWEKVTTTEKSLMSDFSHVSHWHSPLLFCQMCLS